MWERWKIGLEMSEEHALMIYDFGDTEALRLMRAFYQIDDPETRRIILAVAEAAAEGATLNVEKRETEPSWSEHSWPAADR